MKNGRPLEALSGPWQTRWVQSRRVGMEKTDLLFASGKVSGKGSDEDGLFEYGGSFAADGHVRLEKRYTLSFTVTPALLIYSGRWNGHYILGHWFDAFHRFNRGAFEMWPVQAEETVETYLGEVPEPIAPHITFEAENYREECLANFDEWMRKHDQSTRYGRGMHTRFPVEPWMRTWYTPKSSRHLGAVIMLQKASALWKGSDFPAHLFMRDFVADPFSDAERKEARNAYFQMRDQWLADLYKFYGNSPTERGLKQLTGILGQMAIDCWVTFARHIAYFNVFDNRIGGTVPELEQDWRPE